MQSQIKAISRSKYNVEIFGGNDLWALNRLSKKFFLSRFVIRWLLVVSIDVWLNLSDGPATINFPVFSHRSSLVLLVYYWLKLTMRLFRCHDFHRNATFEAYNCLIFKSGSLNWIEISQYNFVKPTQSLTDLTARTNLVRKAIEASHLQQSCFNWTRSY